MQGHMRTGGGEKMSAWIKCIVPMSAVPCHLLVPRESGNGCGWKGPLDVTLSSPLLRQDTWSRLPKQHLAFALMPLPDRPKSFRREISLERLCKTCWTTGSPGLPVLTEGWKGAEFLNTHEKKCTKGGK